MNFIRVLVLTGHALLSGVLLGGALYSIITVQPRAKAYFKDIRDFEAFVANLAHGARWQLLAILAAIATTGFLEPLLSESARPLLWWTCFGVKLVLWTAILSGFVYISWYLWPRRVLAAPGELPAIQRNFAVIGRIILLLLVIAFAIGVAMSHL